MTSLEGVSEPVRLSEAVESGVGSTESVPVCSCDRLSLDEPLRLIESVDVSLTLISSVKVSVGVCVGTANAPEPVEKMASTAVTIIKSHNLLLEKNAGLVSFVLLEQKGAIMMCDSSSLGMVGRLPYEDTKMKKQGGKKGSSRNSCSSNFFL